MVATAPSLRRSASACQSSVCRWAETSAIMPPVLSGAGRAHALRKGRAQHNCAGPFSMRGKSRDFAKERAGSGRASRAMTDLRSLSTNEKAWHLQWRCAWINPCHPPGRKSHPITPGLPCALSGAASPRPIQPARDGAGEEHRGRQTADWAQDRRTRARTRRHRAAR